ncbi:MAG: acylphosphatase [Deltaproteobacteria bacterium RIFOXYB2_FULL_66_7]|nr:MAG: acylphosphatase [Deltaproteobacteria bacterium RIFOXYB2_FULL_66_7]
MAGVAEAHVIVSGRVQGVWFRGTTQRAASAAGVRGWVRNLPDRRVEAVLQGERAAVEIVIEFMRTGPPGSAVIDCVVSWRPVGERYHGFDIRY